MSKVGRVQLARAANRYLFATALELEECLKDEGTPLFDKWVIMMILEGVRSADTRRFNCLMDRLLGRTRQAPEPPKKPNGGAEERVIIEIPDNGRDPKN